jgi:serine/threonine protein phosphatase PrpC
MMQVRPGIEIAGLTDVGCLRPNNEDSYGYWEPSNDTAFLSEGRLAIVADGMGGHEGGQEASRIAVETIPQVYASLSGASPSERLAAAFRAAHEQIILFGQTHPELQGLGTTCTAVALVGGALSFAHMGDSRLYLIRDSRLQRLTRDHTYVGRLLEYGIIGAEEAAIHPNRNILLRALGVGEQIEPELSSEPIALRRGDVIVLCTDGLWSMVSEEELSADIAHRDLDEACRLLVEAVKQRGGPDNITLQILRLSE